MLASFRRCAVCCCSVVVVCCACCVVELVVDVLSVVPAVMWRLLSMWCACCYSLFEPVVCRVCCVVVSVVGVVGGEAFVEVVVEGGVSVVGVVVVVASVISQSSLSDSVSCLSLSVSNCSLRTRFSLIRVTESSLI